MRLQQITETKSDYATETDARLVQYDPDRQVSICDEDYNVLGTALSPFLVDYPNTARISAFGKLDLRGGVVRVKNTGKVYISGNSCEQ